MQEVSMFQVALQGVRDLGFPVVVACWLLFYQAKRTERLVRAVDRLTSAIAGATGREIAVEDSQGRRKE